MSLLDDREYNPELAVRSTELQFVTLDGRHVRTHFASLQKKYRYTDAPEKGMEESKEWADGLWHKFCEGTRFIVRTQFKSIFGIDYVAPQMNIVDNSQAAFENVQLKEEMAAQESMYQKRIEALEKKLTSKSNAPKRGPAKAKAKEVQVKSEANQEK